MAKISRDEIKKKGIMRFLRTFKFSYEGLKYAYANEQSMLTHLILTIITVIIGFIFVRGNAHKINFTRDGDFTHKIRHKNNRPFKNADEQKIFAFVVLAYLPAEFCSYIMQFFRTVIYLFNIVYQSAHSSNLIIIILSVLSVTANLESIPHP